MSTVLISKSQRSLSYNDLKKKRLQRQERRKLKKQDKVYAQNNLYQSNQQVIKKENNLQKLVAIYKPKQLCQIITERQKDKQQESIISKQVGFTERRTSKKYVQTDQSSKNYQKNQFKTEHRPKIQKACESSKKDLIKLLIQKSKSKNRLLKLQDIRNRIKSQKSRQSLSMIKQYQYIGNFIQTPKKNIVNDSISKFTPINQKPMLGYSLLLPKSQKIKKQIRNSSKVSEKSRRQLKNNNADKIFQSKDKFVQSIPKLINKQQKKQKQILKNQLNQVSKKNSFQSINISQIQQQQQKKNSFINQTCLQLLKDITKQAKVKCKKLQSEKILDLLEVNSNQLVDLLKWKDKKKRYQINKLKKIFPQDFFKC